MSLSFTELWMYDFIDDVLPLQFSIKTIMLLALHMYVCVNVYECVCVCTHVCVCVCVMLVSLGFYW